VLVIDNLEADEEGARLANGRSNSPDADLFKARRSLGNQRL